MSLSANTHSGMQVADSAKEDPLKMFDTIFEPDRAEAELQENENASPMKSSFLQYELPSVPERIGDYLGPRVPSLLEFLENKISLRESLGLSHFKKSSKAPNHPEHKRPRHVRQEEGQRKMMAEKDSFHPHVVFASE